MALECSMYRAKSLNPVLKLIAAALVLLCAFLFLRANPAVRTQTHPLDLPRVKPFWLSFLPLKDAQAALRLTNYWAACVKTSRAEALRSFRLACMWTTGIRSAGRIGFPRLNSAAARSSMHRPCALMGLIRRKW